MVSRSYYVENSDYSYVVEEIMIDGFEIFQQSSSFCKKFTLSASAPSYVPPASPAIPTDPPTEQFTRKLPKVSDLDLTTTRPARGGVVVSTMFQGTRWFGFGQDWKTGEITDFGGGIYYGQDAVTGKTIGRARGHKRSHGVGHRAGHVDKNVIDGCLREFKEESLSVFPEISPTVLECSAVLHTEKMMIIVVSLDVCPYTISKNFYARISKMPRHEIRSICWIPEFALREKLLHNIHTKTSPFKLYSKVCTLLKKVIYGDSISPTPPLNFLFGGEPLVP